jgi:hypothetical protein
VSLSPCHGTGRGGGSFLFYCDDTGYGARSKPDSSTGVLSAVMKAAARVGGRLRAVALCRCRREGGLLRESVTLWRGVSHFCGLPSGEGASDCQQAFRAAMKGAQAGEVGGDLYAVAATFVAVAALEPEGVTQVAPAACHFGSPPLLAR